MAVVVVVVLATFVMPKFVVFFKSFNAQLPLPTRMLLSVSNFVSTLVVGHPRRDRRLIVVGVHRAASIAGRARRGSTP